MTIIKNIFGRIFALYVILLFIVTMLIMAIPIRICSWIKEEPKKTRITLSILRVWMNLFLPAILCPVKKKGLEHFKKGQNYIVLFNHNSLMDVPVSSPGVPGANKTLAKVEMSKIPIFGMIYKMGSILVDRKDPQSRRTSYEAMKKVLSSGMHLALYPEGTRNKSTDPLKKFYDGAFILANETQTPILPALIFNTKKILPANKTFYFMPHKIELHFLEPIKIEHSNGNQVVELKEKVFKIMKDYLLDHQKI
ncbi:MAG: lysophospholipid acyltransferase family protein [Chitinophagaceae bacterium]